MMPFGSTRRALSTMASDWPRPLPPTVIVTSEEVAVRDKSGNGMPWLPMISGDSNHFRAVMMLDLPELFSPTRQVYWSANLMVKSRSDRKFFTEMKLIMVMCSDGDSEWSARCRASHSFRG